MKMKKNIRKTWKTMIVLALVLCTVTVPVQAEDLINEDVSSESSILDTVEDTAYQKTRSLHLNMGVIKLKKISPTRAGIGASTMAHHVCEEVYLDLYVDRYNPDTQIWEQWRHWSFMEENVSDVTKSLEIIVRSGYYYSVRGYHSCKHGNVLESLSTQTDGLYIGITDEPV